LPLFHCHAIRLHSKDSFWPVSSFCEHRVPRASHAK
jgi:hypothetical protein